jgi:hypothetical protein
MPQAIQPIFHAVLAEIGTAFALIAVALGGIAYLRANGK